MLIVNNIKWFCIATLLVLLSCKSSRKEAEAVALPVRPGQEVLRAVAANTVPYRTLSVRASASLKPGMKNKRLSAPADLRIIRGQAIRLSLMIPIINSEVFRLTITPDSLLLIDRSHKLAVAESIDNIAKASGYALNYFNLESLFTNYLFIAGKAEVTPADFRSFAVKQEKYRAFIRPKADRNLAVTFTCDYTDRIRTTLLENADKGIRLNWDYDDFLPVKDDLTFPMKMSMLLQWPSDEASLNLSCSGVETDKEFTIDRTLPAKYSRMSLAQYLRIFEKSDE
ncbi:MAG: DUF4292 domain-containing protein [Dysgonamonadaceae bacterium]|nr:DUF4292 domain-containing protein [Dysgonamonadaceae bacterium]